MAYNRQTKAYIHGSRAHTNGYFKKIVMLTNPITTWILSATTIDAGTLSSSPYPGNLEKLKQIETIPNFSIDYSSICMIGVFDELELYCSNEPSSFSKEQKSKVAIKLTVCMFDDIDGLQSPDQFQFCRSLDDNNPSVIKKCVSSLSKRNNWWTTYFGYFNVADSLCHMYSEQFESKRVADMYREMWFKVEGLFDLFSRFENTDLANQVDQQLEEIMEKFKANIEDAEKEQLKVFEARFTELSRTIRSEFDDVKSNVKNLDDFYAEKIGHSFENLDAKHESLQSKLDLSLKKLYQELSEGAISEHKKLLDNLQKENKLLSQQLSYLSNDLHNQVKEKLIEINEFDDRFKKVTNEVIDSFQNIRRMDDVLVDLDFKFMNTMATLGRSLWKGGLISLILLIPISFFTSTMKSTLKTLVFFLGVYYGYLTVQYFL
ncbi:unnamed protein product [Ambrosiozyma monospora]|uniref:Unnamed protein product n=1 Tax=Ambrosiozyma monospora TaxID=43982 RepID=A0ACB5U141_AMBMO|nr:unnamed protein product [Ambrosiozyma monospora]